MSTVRELLVEDIVAEGVDTVFGLMGDGNMAWMASMGAQPGVGLVHARYEGAAVAMADGYARASGRVGVASVTCGPGLTQIVTSLTAAVRRVAALVVVTGDTPQQAGYHLQALDQGPVVRSSGAAHVRVETAAQAHGVVARVFHQARTQRRPVVLSVPYDLQEHALARLAPPAPLPVVRHAPEPHPADVERVAGLLAGARRPMLLVGAGAVEGRAEVLALAHRLGAPVATTLRAKGLLDGEGADVGVAGGFAEPRCRRAGAEADVVLALGARLAHHTTQGGTFFGSATVVHADLEPRSLVDGVVVAEVLVRSDAAALVRALLDDDRLAGHRAAWWPDEPRVAEPVVDPGPRADGVLDPRHVAAALDRAVPVELPVVVGVGNFWGFTVPALHGREPSRYHFTHDFGVIGQALPTGMGVAVAEGRPTVVVEGDGSLLMNIQELESLARHGLPVLVVCVDDGAYGAEFHKLPDTGADPGLAVFGWVALDEVAAAFGLRSARPGSVAELAAAVAAFVADPVPTLLDVRVDVRVPSPTLGGRVRPWGAGATGGDRGHA